MSSFKPRYKAATIACASDLFERYYSNPSMKHIPAEERLNVLAAKLGERLGFEGRRYFKPLNESSQQPTYEFLKAYLIALGSHTEEDFERMQQDIIQFKKMYNKSEGVA